MIWISRTVLAVALVALGNGCEQAEQEAQQPGSGSSTQTTNNGSGGSSQKDNLTAEEKFAKLLEDCSAAGKSSAPLASIADAVALINALPKPATVPCFIAAIPRPFELAATDSTFSGQPAKDKIEPRYILHSKGLLITVVSAGVGKNKVEFSELRGSTESIKGEVAFPVSAEVSASEPYTSIFNSSNGTTSCGFCHVNERAVGEGYPPEATISRALAPAPTRTLLRFDIMSVVEQCATRTTPGCMYTRAMFHGQAPAEYVIPPDMPLK